MVSVCQHYGEEMNLEFSVDPVPAKSKTKCIIFSGTINKTVYPDPIVLYDQPLPYVEQAVHLGHVLSQSLSMEPDCRRARASFMTRASDIREQLHYIHPEQQLQAMHLTCCDAYGSMLWDLYSPAAQMFYNAWNNQVRQAWGVPRDTFTFLVEGFFGVRFVPVRNMIKKQYLKFVNCLATSEFKEVKFMFKVHD